MQFFFANPWGLFALAAIPAIVVIHFLQEQSRRVRASTLFLLEHARPTSETGFRFERFQNTLPLWMQILAAAALAWLLADPRWVSAEQRQTVAVVLDSSASMQAFREQTLTALATRLRDWEAAADRTDWHLLETGPRRPPLYAGGSLKELLAAADDRWQPALGSHAFTDAIVAGRGLVPGGAGGVILVTDRAVDAPPGVAVLSVATAVDNVGFSGGRVDLRDDTVAWQVLITNHSDVSQTRDLTLRAASGGSLAAGEPLAPPQRIDLSPGQSRTFTAAWPPTGPDRIVLALSEDTFALDDALPLVQPMLREVRLVNRLAGPAGELLGKMLTAVDGITVTDDGDEADLVVDRLGTAPAANAVLVASAAAASDSEGNRVAGEAPASALFDAAWVAAEHHPLVRDLGWSSLLSGPAGDTRLSAADTPLLWKDGRPLAFLQTRPRADGRRSESLILNWDLARSTAARTTAVVVMLARFVERVREQLPRSWAANVETGQAIVLPNGRRTRAPETPGFFTVPLTSSAGVLAPSDATNTTEPRPVLTGAAQFADAREGDLRDAAAVDTLDAIRMEQIVKRSVEDPWAPLWLAVVTAALLVAWSWRQRS